MVGPRKVRKLGQKLRKRLGKKPKTPRRTDGWSTRREENRRPTLCKDGKGWATHGRLRFALPGQWSIGYEG